VSRIVFVLGAGASAAAGVPLMPDFITAALEVRRTPNKLSSEDTACFDLVFKARAALQAVHSKSNLNLNNIESLFGTFEMARLIRRLGSLSPEEIERLPDSMARVIARTIETRLKLPVSLPKLQIPGIDTVAFAPSTPRVLPPEPYEDFARLVGELQKRSRNEASIITFNYDLALDYALHYVGIPYSYCLGFDEPADVDVLKLHGSLNWGRCQKCHVIVPWSLRDYFSRFQWNDLFDVKSATLQMTSHLDQKEHCGLPLLPDAAIVPPTWNKGRYHVELANVWHRAAKHLSDAEELFIIGYSFPPTDEFFRYFYALGSVGESILTRVCVLNNGAAAADQFRKILGPAAAEIGCFDAKTELFERSIDWLRLSLHLPTKAARASR
jgi:NAD-dependent SIR2 family protein deacetylase